MTVKTLGDAEDSVWMFRIVHQITQLSQGAALSSSDRGDFDAAHKLLFECMRQCNDARHELWRLAEQHVKDISEGRAVVVGNLGVISALEDFEPTLNRAVNSFFVSSRTALYHLFGQKENSSKGPRARTVSAILTGDNLSFVHAKKDTIFETTAKKYLDRHPGRASVHLIDILRSDRTSWTLGLQEIRDKIIHDTTYQPLKMLYQARDQKVAVGFPRLNGVSLLEFVEMFWNNLVDAVEEIVLACVATRLPVYMAIVPIPEGKRNQELPYRWQAVILPDS
ncbi:MAG: hypothetical protein WB919_06965 [Candidatus Sulfotelmatobacter sp.]